MKCNKQMEEFVEKYMDKYVKAVMEGKISDSDILKASALSSYLFFKSSKRIERLTSRIIVLTTALIVLNIYMLISTYFVW